MGCCATKQSPEVGRALDNAAQSQCLTLRGHQLRHIPAAVWELTALIRVDFSNNRLMQLPTQLGTLTMLRILRVSTTFTAPGCFPLLSG